MEELNNFFFFHFQEEQNTESLYYLSCSSSRKRSRSDDGEKELINISSDEEVLKNDIYPQKPQNVPTATITSERIVGPQTQKPVQVC